MLLLAAVVHRVQLRGRGQKRAHGHVVADGGVGATLDVQGLLRREDAVKVDLDALLAHVEAHVLVAVERVHDAGHDVLARVGLHVVAAPRPVERAVDGGAHGKRRVRQVEHGSGLGAGHGLAHVDGAGGLRGRGLALLRALRSGRGRRCVCGHERAAVAGLAAARGIERRPVQRDGEPALRGLARRHACVELARVGVGVVQLVKRLHVAPPHAQAARRKRRAAVGFHRHMIGASGAPWARGRYWSVSSSAILKRFSART